MVMGDPVLESAYYVTDGRHPDAEVFLVEGGRLEVANVPGRVARMGRILLGVRDAVGWAATHRRPSVKAA
jgi:hypothetical protein